MSSSSLSILVIDENEIRAEPMARTNTRKAAIIGVIEAKAKVCNARTNSEKNFKRGSSCSTNDGFRSVCFGEIMLVESNLMNSPDKSIFDESSF